MHPIQAGRRRFLKEGAALAGLAIATVRSVSGEAPAIENPEESPVAGGPGLDYKTYGERSSFETTGRQSDSPAKAFPAHKSTPIQDTVGIITPSALHYVANHSIPPNIDPKEYRLLVHGMVDRPLIYTLEELKRLPSVNRIYFLECVANSVPMPGHKGGRKVLEKAQDMHGRTSCSEWTGVPLSVLLNDAGLQKEASWLVSDSADSSHWSYDLPLAKAMDDVLVAYGQNGEALRPEQGYPVRLLVPGFHGPYSVKWLRQIKVVDRPYITKGQAVQHAYLRPDLKGKARWMYTEMPPKSVILRPSGGQQLPGPGYYQISGLAWSGGGAVRKVEVSTDGGGTWKDAQLQEPVLRLAHTRFRLDWNWDGGECTLLSRCIDDQGIVQPSLDELDKNWGISSKEYWHSPEMEGPFHFNAIQPWRIDRDGSVHNAMLS